MGIPSTVGFRRQLIVISGLSMGIPSTVSFKPQLIVVSGLSNPFNGGIVVWTSLGPLPRWVPRPTTRWAPGTTRLALHGT
jgi:hypothetical protein